MTALADPSTPALGQLTPQRIASLCRAALFQAHRSLGQTWPNPSVGVVIADPGTGEIIASAVTARGGRPHAESQALGLAGQRARGALMVTTLEPCSHSGETPPCVDAIVKAGIATVIYGSSDCDPRVAGRGLDRLIQNGIAVSRGPFAADAQWLNLGHTLRVTERRPFVQVKLAVDADGKVAVGDGKPVWVTDEEARAQAHLLRAEADAILTGRNTVEHDNPKLTCRLPGLEDRSPIRVILSSKASLPANLAMLDDAGPPVWVIHAETTPNVITGLDAAIPSSLKRGGHDSRKVARRIGVKAGAGGRPDLCAVLAYLTSAGMTRLLVEGGPTVARAFLDAHLADEIIVFTGAEAVSPKPAMLPFADRGLDYLDNLPELVKAGERRVGRDKLAVYRSRRFWHG